MFILIKNLKKIFTELCSQTNHPCQSSNTCLSKIKETLINTENRLTFNKKVIWEKILTKLSTNRKKKKAHLAAWATNLKKKFLDWMWESETMEEKATNLMFWKIFTKRENKNWVKSQKWNSIRNRETTIGNSSLLTQKRTSTSLPKQSTLTTLLKMITIWKETLLNSWNLDLMKD